MASFAAVMGPLAYFQHLISGPRLPFTAAYFGSIALTLYFSIGVSVTVLHLILQQVTETRIASQHHPYLVLSHNSNTLPRVVPRQLLSDGVYRAPDGDELWGTTGYGLDDWLRTTNKAIAWHSV